MKVTLISVGKIKESFYREAVAEYAKRLSAYVDLNLIEVEDEPAGENLSDAGRAAVMDKEGKRILAKIPKGSYVTAFCIDGKQRDSVAMSDWMQELALRGESHITMIIGGSLGLSDEVVRAAKEKISFSKLTFPHQLMRVIVLEQLYRWCRIAKNEPYHK